MLCCRRLGLFGLFITTVAISPAIVASNASGQGLRNVLHARGRVFSAVGPGVAAVKRDGAGRYFVLAEPASVIFVYDAAGKRIDLFPNANSRGATIRYAVAIDTDSLGRLFVADRGDNSVKIFAPDGALVATAHVNAPTSVVALSDGQFAVTTLQSKRLVQIVDQKGATVRTFGDPADEPGAESSTTEPVLDRGRITGDSAGNIYFAFTSLPDPTVQRFDRFGYSAYGSVMSPKDFGPAESRTGREVDLGYAMSGLAGPSVGAWTDLHSLTSVTVGNRATRGTRGPTGTAGAASAAAISSATASTPTDGDFLDYSSDNDGAALDLDPSLFSAAQAGNLGSALGQGFAMPGMMGTGFGDAFHGGMIRDFRDDASVGFRPEFGGHPGGEGDWQHGRPGVGMYRASATVRVALDDPSKHPFEKPVITAVGVDSETQEVWEAVGDVLVHLDKNGNRLDIYYPVIAGDTPLKMTSILVEPDRILIGSDPWGIYEFARPDRLSQSSTKQSIVPQPPSAPPLSQAAH